MLYAVPVYQGFEQHLKYVLKNGKEKGSGKI